MKVDARNPEHRFRYRVYLDGVDVSELVQTADDIAHEVWLVVRDTKGRPVRGNGGLLKAKVMGRVTIVSSALTPPMATVQ